VPGYALALSLLITAPLLGPGYLLLRDAVSTPQSYLSDAALGLTEAAARALPQDFALALISGVVDGGVVVKILLVSGLWAAGWGAARLTASLLPQTGRPGQFIAVTVALWNPYVAERLLQGHWSLLVGYGCLPWVALVVLRLRAGEPGFVQLAFWLGLAGLTPTGLLLAAVVAVVCLAGPGERPRRHVGAAVVGLSTLAALPWLVATVAASSLSSFQAVGVPGVEAFSARAEPGLGTLGSLAGLAGIWNAEAVPGSRSSLFALLATVVLLGVLALGVPVAARTRAAVPLLVLAVVAVVVPALMATGPGLTVTHALLEALPGLGVLRDGQKWVALAVPGYTVAAAGAVVSVTGRLPAVKPALVAFACCVAVIAVLPDLAWGVWGKVSSVRYPPGWAAVAAHVNADPRPVAVLPADSMRQFSWSGPAPVLDPLPRWLRADVLTTGDLTISGDTVPGEGSHARAVQEMLLEGADAHELVEAGVGWVVLEGSSAGEIGSAAITLAPLPVLYQDSELTLYRVGGDAPGASSGQRAAVLAAHGVWLALLVLGAAGVVFRSRR
jgi:hypothetical protein